MELGTVLVQVDELLASHADHIAPATSFHVLTFMRGPSRGSRVRLEAGRTYFIGRSHGADIRVDDPTLSRMHAALSVSDSGDLTLIDAESANGTFINGKRIKTQSGCKLRDGATVILGEHSVFRVTLTDHFDDELRNQMYESSVKDSLTGCFSRRYLMENLEREFALSQRHQMPLAVLIIDVDHFKAINDTHGHQAGDYVLARLAEVARVALRREDLLARYGGEEFVVLARNLSPAGVKMLAERLRLLVAAERFCHDGKVIKVTASIGIGTTSGAACLDVASLCKRADDKLYEAKRSGRNRTCV